MQTDISFYLENLSILCLSGSMAVLAVNLLLDFTLNCKSYQRGLSSGDLGGILGFFSQSFRKNPRELGVLIRPFRAQLL